MLVKIRSAAFSLWLFLFTITVGVLGTPAILFGRDAARAVGQVWARTVLWGLRIIADVRWRVTGAENLPQGGAVIAANHQSMWETIALYALAAKPTPILKKELLATPVWGWWARAVGSIAVDRNGGATALRRMRREALAAIERGEQVIVFPEGTRVAPGTIAPLQPGVAGIYSGAGAPCVPVAHNSGLYWLHPSGEKRPGVITVRILPAIGPGLQRNVFLAELAKRIEAARPDLHPEPVDPETAEGTVALV